MAIANSTSLTSPPALPLRRPSLVIATPKMQFSCVVAGCAPLQSYTHSKELRVRPISPPHLARLPAAIYK